MARKIIMDDDDDMDEDEPQVESEDEVEVEGEGDFNEQQEEDGDEAMVDIEDEDGSEKDDESEEEGLAEDESDLDALSSPPPETVHERAPHLKLKIKLKLRAGNALSTAATATPTPEDPSRAPSRRGASRDVDVESEDSDEDSSRSASAATPGRALTARQAVLRNVVDSSHVSLIEPPNPRKKPPLTEIEIALKREETARKRKNLSEKKLEDEKAETINRLLKKQSRAKGRRNALATAEDRDTPVAASRGEVEDEEGLEGSAVPIPVIPTMYRWVSSVKHQEAIPGEEGAKEMTLSFSVPISVLPAHEVQDDIGMKMDIETPDTIHSGVAFLRENAICDVSGCKIPRKYRLVKDWQRGACGMEHLKMLEGSTSGSLQGV